MLRSSVRDVLGRPTEIFEAGEGTPMLLLHGGLGDAPLHFEAIAPLLATRFHLIAPNLPGFGASAPHPASSFDRLADWLVAILDALAVDRVIVVGNSFGAGLGRVLAARHPDRVTHLVLLGGGEIPKIPAFVRWLIRSPLAAPLFWMMRAMAFSRSGLRRAIRDEALLSLLAERSRKSAPSFVALMREVALGEPPASDRPRCPTRAIWGEHDGLFPLAAGRKIAAAVAAELTVIDGIAHLPQREAPEATARLIEAFVAS